MVLGTILKGGIRVFNLTGTREILKSDHDIRVQGFRRDSIPSAAISIPSHSPISMSFIPLPPFF